MLTKSLFFPQARCVLEFENITFLVKISCIGFQPCLSVFSCFLGIFLPPIFNPDLPLQGGVPGTCHDYDYYYYHHYHYCGFVFDVALNYCGWHIYPPFARI